MPTTDKAVAVFDEHIAAEKAITKLTRAGFDMKTLSIVGKGFHTEEKVTGFHNTGDRIRFWGMRGAFWGGFRGLFFGGVFITLAVTGPVIVVGYLTATLIAMIEGAVIVGSLIAIGGSLASIGVPEDRVIKYEAVIRADGFLVMAHGTAEEIARAKGIMPTANASQTTVHPPTGTAVPIKTPPVASQFHVGA